jgi:hypothetical protein
VEVEPLGEFGVTFVGYDAPERGGLPRVCMNPLFPALLRSAARGWAL